MIYLEKVNGHACVLLCMRILLVLFVCWRNNLVTFSMQRIGYTHGWSCDNRTDFVYTHG